MRLGSTILFAAAGMSIAVAVNNVIRAVGGDRAWLTSLLAGGALAVTIICAYVGFRLFRNGN